MGLEPLLVQPTPVQEGRIDRLKLAGVLARVGQPPGRGKAGPGRPTHYTAIRLRSYIRLKSRSQKGVSGASCSNSPASWCGSLGVMRMVGSRCE